MTIIAIRNGLFAHLTACGPYAPSEISTCSFDVLTSVAASALTFFPDGTSTFEPDTMSANSRHVHKSWLIGGTLWIRDRGDPTAVLSRIWQGYDDLQSTLAKDETLGGVLAQSGAAYLRTITSQLNRFHEAGGHLWKTVDWTVMAEEF